MSGTAAPAQEPPRYKLRLFMAGTSARSLRSLVNLHHIGTRYLAGRMDLEVVDIYQQPAIAERDQVVAAPTLVKLSPAPPCHVIGDLSDLPRVLRCLGLEPFPEHDDGR